LAQLLVRESFDAHQAIRLNISEIFELIEKGNPNAVCIAALAPFFLSHIRFFCTKLHQRKPQLPIVIGLFGFPEAGSEILDKLISAGATKVVFTLSQAVTTLQEMRSGK
jgi:hypothetical protein